MLCLCATLTHAQIGIGTITPNSTAELDVSSTTRGLLIPRLTKTERNAITSPANGLQIYQTTDSIGLTYFKVDHWVHALGADEVTTATSTGGAIIPFASGGSVPITTVVGGVLNTSAAVGFGSSFAGITLLGSGNLDLTNAGGTVVNYSFSVPRSGTITAISGYFSATVSLNLGGTVTISAQLYKATGPTSNQFAPVTASKVNFSPSLSTLNVGTMSSGLATGLNIPVVAGERYILLFSTSAPGLATVTTGYVGGSININ